MLTVRRVPRSRVALPATLSSVETVVALSLAHVAAGGAVPEPVPLAAFGLLAYGAGLVVLRRRASVRVVLPVLVAAQVLGHAWLVALAPGAHAAHAAPAAPGAHAEPAPDGFLGLGTDMVVAHLVAGVVTGVAWVLRRRAVEVLLRWTDPGRLPLPGRPVRPVVSHRSGHRPRHRTSVAPTRGPPAVLAAT